MPLERVHAFQGHRHCMGFPKGFQPLWPPEAILFLDNFINLLYLQSPMSTNGPQK